MKDFGVLPATLHYPTSLSGLLLALTHRRNMREMPEASTSVFTYTFPLDKLILP